MLDKECRIRMKFRWVWINTWAGPESMWPLTTPVTTTLGAMVNTGCFHHTVHSLLPLISSLWPTQQSLPFNDQECWVVLLPSWDLYIFCWKSSNHWASGPRQKLTKIQQLFKLNQNQSSFGNIETLGLKQSASVNISISSTQSQPGTSKVTSNIEDLRCNLKQRYFACQKPGFVSWSL